MHSAGDAIHGKPAWGGTSMAIYAPSGHNPVSSDGNGNTILGRIANFIGVFDNEKDRKREWEKRQSEEDRDAKSFLDDLCYIFACTKKFNIGTLTRIIAETSVSFGIASILTKLPIIALKSAAQNIYKLQNNETLLLLNILEIARYEILIPIHFPYRGSYQSCVKNYINDYINTEYQQFFTTLCSNYYDMNCEQAKAYETELAILAGYFRIYPPKEVNSTAHIKIAASSTATACVINNNTVNVTVDIEPLQRLLAGLNNIRSTGQADVPTDPAPPPAGQTSPSMEAREGTPSETDRAKRTRRACEQLIRACKNGYHLDSNGKIGLAEFQDLVCGSMESCSEGKYLNKSEVARCFNSSEDLIPFKRKRGERIKSNS
jgi:hypothetical protein